MHTRGVLELAELLARGEVSAEEVTLAHLARIDEQQPRVRALAQVFRERALVRARASDRRRRAGEARSALDGVPLTIKENFHVAGEVTTMGVSENKGRVSDRSAVIVELVEEAGMVLLGKSNLSQLMLFHESRNPVYGESKNPWNPARTPGGSSGGEAAAVAACMSPGGFGGDIGGSIRVPAHFCGVFGLKPTVDRISGAGVGSSIPGQEAVRGQVGPFARHARDLSALLEVTSPFKSAARDPRVPPLPLVREDRPRRIGYFASDGFLEVSYAIERAVERARVVLEAAGHTLVPFRPPLVEELLYTYLGALSADGAQTALSQVGRGELDEALTLLARMARLPRRPKELAGRAIASLVDGSAGRTLQHVGEKSVAELWKLTARAREIQTRVFDAWKMHELDAVICPPHATPALQHGASRDFTLGAALSIRYNLLDFPAGVAPITRVVDGEEVRERDKGRLQSRARSVEEGSRGLPVGVQVVGRPFREDVVLQLLEDLEDGVSGDEGYPTLS